MGTGGTPGTPWQTGQGTVLQDIAHQEGWSSVVLSNQHSPSTSLSNAEVFILDKCNAVIEGPTPESTDPVIAAKLAAAKIPVITFDITQKGWYFVGINNSLAGMEGGEALGADHQVQVGLQPGRSHRIRACRWSVSSTPSGPVG